MPEKALLQYLVRYTLGVCRSPHGRGGELSEPAPWLLQHIRLSFRRQPHKQNFRQAGFDLFDLPLCLKLSFTWFKQHEFRFFIDRFTEFEIAFGIRILYFSDLHEKPSKQSLDFLYILNYNGMKKAVQTAGAKIDSRLHQKNSKTAGITFQAASVLQGRTQVFACLSIRRFSLNNSILPSSYGLPSMQRTYRASDL